MARIGTAQHPLTEIEDAEEQSDMALEMAIEELLIEPAQNIVGMLKHVGPVFPAQAIGELLEQYGDEGRGRPMARHIGQVEQHVLVRDGEVVDVIAGKVEGRQDLMGKGDATNGRGRLRQHALLQLAPRGLVAVQRLQRPPKLGIRRL